MRALLLACALILSPLAAQAYIGPGAGAGALAVTVAVVLGIVLLLVGFLWFPLKRMLKGKPKDTVDHVTGPSD